ncbi:MAG: hypothetical protein H6713_17510 [Myxococcales bacterium]|nr:hypothetical protein [Myxococcales bacterium]
MNVPDTLDLLAFFEADPVDSDDEFFYEYLHIDPTGVTLRFTFDIGERSVQTELRLGERVVDRVCSEGAVRIGIESLDERETLRVLFEHVGVKTTLDLVLKPQIEISWSTLRV